MMVKLKPTTIDLSTMDRDEWLKWRKMGLGGSDAAAALGLSPWKSPYALYLEKRGLIEDDIESERMLWGSLLEPVVADQYLATRDDVIDSLDKLGYQHPEHDFLLASPDRVLTTATDTEILEVKTSDAFAHKTWVQGEVPDQYALQAHHYMLVTGFAVVQFAILVGGNHLETLTMERDETLLGDLLEAEGKFWDCVVNERPPAVDGSESTKEALASHFKVKEGTSVEGGEMLALALAILAEHKSGIKALEEGKILAENRIKAILGENEVGLVDGEAAVTWKEQTRKESVRVIPESTFRVLRPKEIK
jgi:putative phage-type endonuclease